MHLRQLTIPLLTLLPLLAAAGGAQTPERHAAAPAAVAGTAGEEPAAADTVIVVVNLDGHNAHQAIVHLERGEFGLPTDKPVKVRDELTGREFEWGWDNFVSLAPWADVAHVLTVVED